MRLIRTSFSAFQAWPRVRLLLPVGFAAIVAAGTYVVADGNGYERGLAEQAQKKDIARLVVEPSEVFLANVERAAKADREDIPVLLRAIDPAAVYRPSAKPAVANSPAAATRHVAARSAEALPAGVERFDRCGSRCDTRDPMIVRTNYPITASAEPLDAPAAPAPLPPVAAESDGLTLPSAGEIVDRTVAGTAAVYGSMRDGAASVLDTMQQAVSGTLDLMR